MPAEECRSRLRYRLSDESGVLRFAEFTIRSAPAGEQDQLREYLIGRALTDVDLEHLEGLARADSRACTEAVIREVRKQRRRFVHNRGD
jgi:hypothetical protein